MVNTVKFAYFLALLAFLLSSAVCVTPADAQAVHALLVIMDDDPSIGKSVDVDRQHIKKLLNSVQNEICDVETTILLSSKDTATHDGILRWVQNINVATNDVVFIYYSGHGGMNSEGKTFLVTEGKFLYRSDLVNALEHARLPRLTLLITDCCSSLVESNLEPMLQSSRSGARPTQQVLNNLFLEHRGFLHLTSASEGQYAWGNSATGGWFTMGLINAMKNDPDKNRDSFLSWKEVFVTTRENTENTFRRTTFGRKALEDMKRRGITSQTPKAYSLPTPLSESAFTTEELKTEELKIVNLIFIAVVFGTLGISGRISRKLKKQYVSRSRLRAHRSKAFAVIGIEVLMWIGFNIFWQFFRANWLLICIGGVVIISMILFRKKKRYA